MALYPIHKYFIFNRELRQNETFIPCENEGGIYEVFRIVNGVPLFFDEHINRFFGSATLSEREIHVGKMQIKELLEKLIQKNNVEAGNVLLSYKTNLKAFFIPHKYPVKNDYVEGIKCGILNGFYLHNLLSVSLKLHIFQHL